MAVIGAGRYQLGDELARGAIGVVVRALDTVTGQPVAVKRLRPETAVHPDSVVGFLAEAEILANLHHPGIVRLRELVSEPDGYALVLDLIEGADLRRRVRAGGPLPPAVAVEVVAAVADALGYVHGRGYVHGDIKPGNVVVPDDGGPVRLVDFGVARRIGERERTTYATPEYVSPEVVMGDAPGPAADVYALGMVLYELCCGRSCFRGGDSDAVLRRHLTCVPVPPPGLADSIWPVIQACLEFVPGHRPAAAALPAQLRSLLPALSGLPASAPLGADAVTWWPREADETAPIMGLQRVKWMPANRQNPDAGMPERMVAVPMPADEVQPVTAGHPVVLTAAPAQPLWPAQPPIAAQAVPGQPAGPTGEPPTIIGVLSGPGTPPGYPPPAGGQPAGAFPTSGAPVSGPAAGAVGSARVGPVTSGEPGTSYGELFAPPAGGYQGGYDSAGYQGGGQPAGRSKAPLFVGLAVAVVVLIGLLGVGGYLLRDRLFGDSPTAGVSSRPSTTGSASPSGSSTPSTSASPSPATSPSQPTTAPSQPGGRPSGTPVPGGTPSNPIPSGLPSIGGTLPSFP